MHLPWRRIAAEASDRIAPGTPVVVYCWGPGCNGATNAALQFALLGHPVKEMLGGFEYWVREGFAYDGPGGPRAPRHRRAHERDRRRARRRGGAARRGGIGRGRARDRVRLLTQGSRAPSAQWARPAASAQRSGPRRASSHSVCSRRPLRTAALMIR